MTADSERKKNRSDSRYFLLISCAVRDTYSNTLMSRVAEKANERQRALLIPLIQTLPLKKTHPLTPPLLSPLLKPVNPF